VAPVSDDRTCVRRSTKSAHANPAANPKNAAPAVGHLMFAFGRSAAIATATTITGVAAIHKRYPDGAAPDLSFRLLMTIVSTGLNVPPHSGHRTVSPEMRLRRS